MLNFSEVYLQEKFPSTDSPNLLYLLKLCSAYHIPHSVYHNQQRYPGIWNIYQCRCAGGPGTVEFMGVVGSNRCAGGPETVGQGYAELSLLACCWRDSDVGATFTSMSTNWHHKSLAAAASSPFLALLKLNSTSIAALQDMWVRSFADPFFSRYSSCTTKP